jgi:hypothetical protein
MLDIFVSPSSQGRPIISLAKFSFSVNWSLLRKAWQEGHKPYPAWSAISSSLMSSGFRHCNESYMASSLSHLLGTHESSPSHAKQKVFIKLIYARTRYTTHERTNSLRQSC